jgi:hypothetical protein
LLAESVTTSYSPILFFNYLFSYVFNYKCKIGVIVMYNWCEMKQENWCN